MILLSSDLFRALWYLIHPSIVLARGTVQSGSKYCQASGFLLALSTEASGMMTMHLSKSLITEFRGIDFAILVIAIHVALFIFRPPKTIGQGGIYNYRYVVYGLWIIFPVLAASLAFVNSTSTYITTGTFCYLPSRPFWYRLALAWIPRYIILITICLIYITIFIYVRVKFRGFSALGGSTMEHYSSKIGSSKDGPDDTMQTRRRNSITPPLPKLERHGLIPGSEDGQSVTSPKTPRKQSVGTLYGDPESSRKASIGDYGLGSEAPRKFSAGKSSLSPESHRKVSSGQNALDIDRPGTHSGVCTLSSPQKPKYSQSRISSESAKGSLRGFLVVGGESVKQSSFIGDVLEPNLRVKLPPLREVSPQASFRDSMEATRTAIRRQLRFLFIYPLVYLLLWTLPFVAHCLSYSDHFVMHPIFPLNLLNVTILSLLGAVDAWIFCWRERPWRRMKGQKRLRSLRKTDFWGGWWNQRVAWWQKMTARGDSRRGGVDDVSVSGNPTIEMGPMTPMPTPMLWWWEEEGRKRGDSVWIGTDGNIESERRKSKSKSKLTILSNKNTALGEVEESGTGESQVEAEREDTPVDGRAIS
jgi:G protein-coupled receptor GPR1